MFFDNYCASKAVDDGLAVSSGQQKEWLVDDEFGIIRPNINGGLSSMKIHDFSQGRLDFDPEILLGSKSKSRFLLDRVYFLCVLIQIIDNYIYIVSYYNYMQYIQSYAHDSYNPIVVPPQEAFKHSDDSDA